MANKENEKPDVKPVVTGKVNKKKKGMLSNLVEEDGRTIMNEIKDEILIPTLKDVIFNTVRTGIEMMLWGESSGGYTTRNGRTGNGTRNYNQMYSNRVAGSSNRNSARRGTPKSRYGVEVVEFDSKADADAVLDVLSDLMENYGVFSIADYYKAAGTDYEYTDENYGWYDMRGIQIVHIRGGLWTIDFPKAVSLED